MADLGIRIVGEVTASRLGVLREADAIAREELSRAGLDRGIWIIHELRAVNRVVLDVTSKPPGTIEWE